MEKTTHTHHANSTEPVVIKNKNNISNFLTPISIIVVGVLIASALYFREPGKSTAKKDLFANQEAKTEIQDIRDTDHIRGNKNAKVVIIEYSDTECPFCKIYHNTMKKIFNEYEKSGDVAWVYRHFPVSYGSNARHPNAAKEAEATECAAELGGSDMFWKYIDELYAIKSDDGKSELKQLSVIAEKLGLDKERFQKCLDSNKYAEKIKSEYDNALKAGAQGTPYTVIKFEKELIPLLDNTGQGVGAVPYEILKQVIEQNFLNPKN